MKTYSIDVMIYGTVYVEAGSKAEARRLVIEHCGQRSTENPTQAAKLETMSIGDDHFLDREGRVSLSAALTLYGADIGADVEQVA